MTSDADMMGWRTFAASRADPDLLAQIPGSTDHTISKQTIAELAGIASHIAGKDPSKFKIAKIGEDQTPLATSDIWAQAATEWIRRGSQADFLDHLWDEDETVTETDQIDIEDIPEPPPVLTADMVKRMMDYRRYMKGYRRGQYSQRRGGYYRGRGSYGYRRGGYNGYYRRGRY